MRARWSIGLLGLVPVVLHARPPVAAWFGHLRTGQWVKVEGQARAGGGLQVQEIKILGGEQDEIEISAVIVAVDSTRRRVRTTYDLEVVATPRTDIHGCDRTSFAALRPGDRIEAECQPQKDGGLLVAVEIEVKAPETGTEEDELTARIESLDAGKRRIVLLGVAAYVDERTLNRTRLPD